MHNHERTRGLVVPGRMVVVVASRAVPALRRPARDAVDADVGDERPVGARSGAGSGRAVRSFRRLERVHPSGSVPRADLRGWFPRRPTISTRSPRVSRPCPSSKLRKNRPQMSAARRAVGVVRRHHRSASLIRRAIALLRLVGADRRPRWRRRLRGDTITRFTAATDPGPQPRPEIHPAESVPTCTNAILTRPGRYPAF